MLNVCCNSDINFLQYFNVNAFPAHFQHHISNMKMEMYYILGFIF